MALKVKLPERLQRSQFFAFWSELEKDQEVRWTGAKAQTYFINGVQLYKRANDGRPQWMQTGGPFIILRRHSGKTFYASLSTVRPVDWVKPERPRRHPSMESFKEFMP